MEMSRDNDHKRSVYKQQIAAPISFCNIRSWKQITFSYQRADSTTKTDGLQRYCCLGQANFYRICGLWWMPKQIWTIFLIEKWFQPLGCFNKDDNKDFLLVQNLTMGEADFNQLVKLENQLVVTAENFREENLSPVQIPTISKEMDGQLKLQGNGWTTQAGSQSSWCCDRANRNIYVTLLRYDVDKPESSYAQVRFFARKEEEKFQQIVYVNYKRGEFIHLFDVTNLYLIKLLPINPFVISYEK